LIIKDIIEYIKEVIIKTYLLGLLGFLLTLISIPDTFFGARYSDYVPVPVLQLIGIILLLISSFIVYRDQRKKILELQKEEPKINAQLISYSIDSRDWSLGYPQSLYSDVWLDITNSSNTRGRVTIDFNSFKENTYAFLEKPYYSWLYTKGRNTIMGQERTIIEKKEVFDSTCIRLNFPLSFASQDDFIQKTIAINDGKFAIKILIKAEDLEFNIVSEQMLIQEMRLPNLIEEARTHFIHMTNSRTRDNQINEREVSLGMTGLNLLAKYSDQQQTSSSSPPVSQ
jgi:hypothetical protein